MSGSIKTFPQKIIFTAVTTLRAVKLCGKGVKNQLVEVFEFEQDRAQIGVNAALV